MATTTNYSWTTPDDTALVKDGAAAIRSLGTAIDTTVFNNAGAAIAKTIVDAKGDLIAGTADNTVARLASSGSNGNVLTVDTSTATGLAWTAPAAGGGLTLLSTTTLSGASTNITGISTSYKNLYIVVSGVTATSNYATSVRPNNNSSSIYFRQVNRMETATTPDFTMATETEIPLPYAYSQTSSFADNIGIITIENYASSSTRKPYSTFYAGQRASNTAKYNEIVVGIMESNTAITSLNFIVSAGTFSTGTVLVYGVS
jgi:hypothetical protein